MLSSWRGIDYLRGTGLLNRDLLILTVLIWVHVQGSCHAATGWAALSSTVYKCILNISIACRLRQICQARQKQRSKERLFHPQTAKHPPICCNCMTPLLIAAGIDNSAQLSAALASMRRLPGHCRCNTGSCCQPARKSPEPRAGASDWQPTAQNASPSLLA